MFVLQSFKGLSDWWRYAAVVALVVLGYVVGQIPVTIAFLQGATESGVSLEDLDSQGGMPDLYATGLNQNLIFALLLLMFVLAMAALYYGVKRLHKRSILTIATARPKLDWNRVFFGFGVWMSFSLILEAWAYYQDPGNYIWQWQPIQFLILLLISLTLLPIQTSFEELFVRGYLFQGLAKWSRSRILPIVLTSLLFGLLHIFNPEVMKFGVGTMMFYYISIAIFLGVITILDDGLELALGIHAATNMYGALFVTFESSAIQTPALLQMVEVDASGMALTAIGACILFFGLAHWKFGFEFQRLTGPFVPDSWGQLIQDMETQGSVSVLQVASEQGSMTTTTNLIKWDQLFHRDQDTLNFELAIPELSSFNSDWVEQVNDDKKEIILQKLIDYADSELVRYGHKMRLSLDDGSIIPVALIDKKENGFVPYPNIPWTNYTKMVIPLKPDMYDAYQNNYVGEVLSKN